MDSLIKNQSFLHTPELLLPAGSFDSALAAFEGGADAVYFGFKEFSARASARNFTREEYRRLLHHARDTGKAVYAAINTLIFPHEMHEAASLLAFLAEFPPDALILQDWGLVRLIRHSFPGLTMHASTQMAIQSADAARLAQERGIHRIVMPRETDMESLKAIIRECPGMEFEVFVHGALCYSYSGFCHASRVLTGRSGNRGECAQICRSWFTRMPYGKKSRNQPDSITDIRNGAGLSSFGNETDRLLSGEGPGYWFSCKDLDLSGRIGELADAGVHSFKIEGRMKGPEYTKSVAQLYRNILSAREHPGNRMGGPRSASGSFRPIGGLHEKNREEVRLTFARAPTEAYFLEKHGQNLVDPVFPGHRGVIAGQILNVSPFFASHTPSSGLHDSTSVHPDNEFPGTLQMPGGRNTDDGAKYLSATRGENRTQWLLEVRLESDLGLKDGLMLEAPAPPSEPVRFSCSRILDARTKMDKYRARIGETVLIPAPEKALKGQRIFRISARYLDLRKAAPEEFEPARFVLPVLLEAAEGKLMLRNIPSCDLPGFSFLYVSDILPLTQAKHPGSFQKALQVFSECKEFEFKLIASFSEKPATGPDLPPEGIALHDIFLPPSMLKMEKNVVYERVSEALTVWRKSRVSDALEKNISVSPFRIFPQTRMLAEKSSSSALPAGNSGTCFTPFGSHLTQDASLPPRSRLTFPRPGVSRGMPWATAPSLEAGESLPEADTCFWLPLMPVVCDWDRYEGLIVSLVGKELNLGHTVAVGISAFHHIILARKLHRMFSGYSGYFDNCATCKLKFFMDFTMNVANISAWHELQEAAGIPMPAYPCAERIESFIPPLFISKGCLKRHGVKDTGCPPQCSRTWFSKYSGTNAELVSFIEDCISVTFLEGSRGQGMKLSDEGQKKNTDGHGQ